MELWAFKPSQVFCSKNYLYSLYLSTDTGSSFNGLPPTRDSILSSQQRLLYFLVKQFLEHKSMWVSAAASCSLFVLYPCFLPTGGCGFFLEAYCVRGKNLSNHLVPPIRRSYLFLTFVFLTSVPVKYLLQSQWTGFHSSALLALEKSEIIMFSFTLYLTKYLLMQFVTRMNNISMNSLMHCFCVWWKRKKEIGWEMSNLDKFPICSISPLAWRILNSLELLNNTFFSMHYVDSILFIDSKVLVLWFSLMIIAAYWQNPEYNPEI